MQPCSRDRLCCSQPPHPLPVHHPYKRGIPPRRVQYLSFESDLTLHLLTQKSAQFFADFFTSVPCITIRAHAMWESCVSLVTAVLWAGLDLAVPEAFRNGCTLWKWALNLMVELCGMPGSWVEQTSVSSGDG